MPKSLEAIGKYQCRWTDDVRAPFMFCAAAVRNGSSYCDHHHPLVWIRYSGGKSVRMTDKPQSTYSRIMPTGESW